MIKEEIKNRMKPKDELDDEFKIYVSELLDLKILNGEAVIGIGKKIADEGIEDLTEKQINTFISYGLEPNYKSHCDLCYIEIPWSEMVPALEDGHCSYCRHKLEKED